MNEWMMKFILRISLLLTPRQLHTFPSYLLGVFWILSPSPLIFPLFLLLYCSHNLFLFHHLTFSSCFEECIPPFQAYPQGTTLFTKHNSWWQLPRLQLDIIDSFFFVAGVLISRWLQSQRTSGRSSLVNTEKLWGLTTMQAHFKPFKEEKKHLPNLKWNLTVLYFIFQS